MGFSVQVRVGRFNSLSRTQRVVMINLFLVYVIIGPLVCLIANMLIGLINCSDHGDYERSNGYECG